MSTMEGYEMTVLWKNFSLIVIDVRIRLQCKKAMLNSKAGQWGTNTGYLLLNGDQLLIRLAML
jgi:hypothetical protein